MKRDRSKSDEPPRPGHGCVFVTPDLPFRYGRVDAIWQDEHRYVSRHGTLEEMLTWARCQPGVRFFFPNAEGTDRVEVTPPNWTPVSTPPNWKPASKDDTSSSK